jgi:PQQ-like domain
MTPPRALRFGAWVTATMGLSIAAAASAQTVDVQRPRTLTVGTPGGSARVDRVDGARTGRARTELPVSGLRTDWRTPLGTLVEHAPLVDERGTTYVVGTRGEVVAIARDGSERWRAPTGAAQPGPAAILSDDTVVFVDAAGEAVAARDGAVRWRVRFGRGAAALPAPLALDDGGVVVATTQELAALDSDGRERTRTTLREATTLPLVAALGKVVAITASGAVWSWTLGAAEPTRLGSFGTPIDGGAALADDHTLIAVTAGQTHLATVDLLRGTTTTRAIAPTGLWLGPPAMRGAAASLVLLTATSELAMTVDGSGREVARTLLALHPLPLSLDGGVAALVAGPHTPALVDAQGVLAFATLGGAIGVTNQNTVELLSDACEPPLGPAGRAAPPVAGLAPLEGGAFVAVCSAGAVLAISGQKSRPQADQSGGRTAPHL